MFTKALFDKILPLSYIFQHNSFVVDYSKTISKLKTMDSHKII